MIIEKNSDVTQVIETLVQWLFNFYSLPQPGGRSRNYAEDSAKSGELKSIYFCITGPNLSQRVWNKCNIWKGKPMIALNMLKCRFGKFRGLDLVPSDSIFEPCEMPWWWSWFRMFLITSDEKGRSFHPLFVFAVVIVFTCGSCNLDFLWDANLD